MRAILVAIGDEIVEGRTTDTNSGFLAQLLQSLGVEPLRTIAVRDDEAAITAALEQALAEVELVVTTGGLGPTADDRTAVCAARVVGRPLELDEDVLRTIEERFRARGLPMPANNRRQARVPRGCTRIPNPEGTAVGHLSEVGRGEAVHHLVCLPGVPREMRRMAEESLAPWLQAMRPGVHFGSRVFSTFGLTESQLDEALADIVDPAEGRLSFRAAFPRLQLRVTVSAESAPEAERRLDALETRIRGRLGARIYATEDCGLEHAVGRLLRGAGLTIGVAESCTGGLIGHRITEVPGSSAYFLLGVIAYSDAAKQRLLDVDPRTLERFGAVSTETVAEMAQRVRRLAEADIGLATSGIAGPGGGSADKPVGTVCLGLAWAGGVWSRRYQLGDRSREWVKEMTTQLALDRLRRHLEEERGTTHGPAACDS